MAYVQDSEASDAEAGFAGGMKALCQSFVDDDVLASRGINLSVT